MIHLRNVEELWNDRVTFLLVSSDVFLRITAEQHSNICRCLFFKISDAINAIENVAEHINEMQSITEQFLQIFQELAKSSGLEVAYIFILDYVIETRYDELLYYCYISLAV